MKRITIAITLIVVFIGTATVSASVPDVFTSPVLESPVPTMIPPDVHHYNAPIVPDVWRHLRAVPLTAEDWEAIGR